MILFLLAIAPGLAFILYIYLKDKYNREPFSKLLICFLLGALSCLPAVFLESVGQGVLHSLGYPVMTWINGGMEVDILSSEARSVAVFAWLVVGLSEELCKFLFLRYYAYRLPYFDEPLDGIVYAMMIGMGFATFENIFYVLQNGALTGVMRSFLAVPAHATFAVMMGYFVGRAKFNPPHEKADLFKGLALAVFFHGAYDFSLFVNRSFSVIGAVISLIIAIRLSRRAIKGHRDLSEQLHHDAHGSRKLEK